ncbi:transcriptional regulator NanR [Sinorhizobium sp. BG8]|uniref:transcriptional regulator NanR n=1 Tax=Sinorhizobium sp. BG8 TaxID=2613773 RepID=UPI00193D02C6|nr:transcriptional regulator NanR [Sinorhizobium sp. BG8]QRM54165.1 transcriptional regulator NanR [Sinorhizobium sp. BG8]
MVMQSEPIVRRKLSDEVFERLKRLIETGELRPGDEMPSERTLMERFQVGRPAIREAMQALSNMGLLEISHGERAKVLKPTAQSLFRQMDVAAKIMLSASSDSLEHLKNARIFFERGMVREAAVRAKPADIARLEETLARQKSLLGDSDAFIGADMEFHTCIARISGNPIYTAVSEAMLGWLKAYHTEMLIWTGRENFTLSEHEEIIDCIRSGDPEAAERAMIKHLERSRALYTLKTKADG